MFTAENLPKEILEDMIAKNIYSDKCPIHYSQLQLLNLSYFGFDGSAHHDGKMIVYKGYAEQTLNIFKILFANQFPIEKIKLINDYNGSDEDSMADNNTSAFNCRLIAGSDKLSIHSYGLAIDINPMQNPYITFNDDELKLSPISGKHFLNRNNIKSGMVENLLLKENKTVIEIFKENGFTVWGGEWNDPIDYHHFQVTRELCEEIAGEINYIA
jgi:hypothetical protein